ncbi:MAG TPA: hypothetical protein VFD58_30585 [Blastocatellia bacterium]|nr:hypothetical protein [Blastocatellia bacterium]
MSGNYRIEFSSGAERVYNKLFDEAQACLTVGRAKDRKVTLFRVAEELIFTTIASNPFDAGIALPGYLSQLFRINKSGICVVYLGLPEFSRITIQYILSKQSRDCHTSDPYSSLMRLARNGKIEEFLNIIGVQAPNILIQPRNPSHH